jgi:hypothetical protein
MNCEHLAMRDGRWVFLDFKGKGNKTRSVAVPLWVKRLMGGWTWQLQLKQSKEYLGSCGDSAETKRSNGIKRRPYHSSEPYLDSFALPYVLLCFS